MRAESSPIVLQEPGANVRVEELPSGKRKIVIEKTDPDLYVRFYECETAYPLELIQTILKVKGPAWLCDEIARDESEEYTGAALERLLLSYMDREAFREKRILDFGCGAGASTSTLARMFPSAKIVGIELERKLLDIAEARAEYYGYSNVEHHLSPSGDRLPDDLGRFDFVIMTGVYEHLLPEERDRLLPKLWSIINPGGVLFLHETPYRYFPIETHTSGGLPLLNYLPARAAAVYARLFSRRNLHQDSWKTLLRKGIRGASISEIRRIVMRTENEPTLLSPNRLGIKDRVDLWYVNSPKSRHAAARKLIRSLSKAFRTLTGIEIVPYLELAFVKERRFRLSPNVRFRP